MMNTKTFAKTAMIAAVYTVVTLALAPLSYGNLQVRISEALTILPLVYKPSIQGVALGCFLANLIGAMTGLNPTGYIDAVIGTLATLAAAWCTWRFRDIKIGKLPILSLLMPAVWNFFFVGGELAVLYMPNNVVLGTLINGSWVALGELIAAALGYILVNALKKTMIFEE